MGGDDEACLGMDEVLGAPYYTGYTDGDDLGIEALDEVDEDEEDEDEEDWSSESDEEDWSSGSDEDDEDWDADWDANYGGADPLPLFPDNDFDEQRGSLALSQLGAPEFTCWAPAYGRGVGKVGKKCNKGWRKSGALCYPKCRSGYKGVGPVCWQKCPSGWRNDGAFCKKPPAHGRGVGKVRKTKK